jgi:hypothetical protein
VRASVKGLIQRPGEPKHSLSAGGVLALRPGALPASLELDDANDEAAQLLGLVGVYGGSSLSGVGHAFDGLQLGAQAAQRGVLALNLQLKGKSHGGLTPWQAFEPQQAAGALQAATPQAVVTAKVKSGKRLN